MVTGVEKKIQLFILPYAGGSIAAFKRFTEHIDNAIEVIVVEYPGRGTRAKEPLVENFNELLSDAVSFCRERRVTDLPFAVMGYSMGSILAYEIAAHNEIEGALEHLFIAAEISPKFRSAELSNIGTATDDMILERAKMLGGLNESILLNKRFAEIYISPMLSDYRNFFGYRYGKDAGKIKADATFFYCEKDTPKKKMEKWNDLIDGNTVFYEFGENHFFINHHYKEMALVINETLCQ